jgi:TonB family protein
MTILPASHRLAILLAASLVFPSIAAADQEALARAKELYAAAAYDEALAALDGVPKDVPAADSVEVAKYRVFCLLALGRQDDARKTITALVSANPLFHLPEGQASPRIQAVFSDIRRQVFPEIVQRSYTDAKAAFDRHDADAGAKFDRVIALLDDPDARAVPSLADLRTVAAGFRDLSKAADPPVPQTPPAKAPAPTAAAPAPSPPPAQPAAVNQSTQGMVREHTGAAQPGASADTPSGSGIIPPVAIYQPLPPWVTSPADRQEYRGTLELLIDRTGTVTSAKLRASVNPRYDAELIRTARTWRFRPATKDGSPVPYVKVVDVQLIPR